MAAYACLNGGLKNYTMKFIDDLNNQTLVKSITYLFFEV